MNAQNRDLEQAICSIICRNSGILAREIASELGINRSKVNQVLYRSSLLKELCWQDSDFRWHGILTQGRPHYGLQEFSGYYSSVREFLSLSEDQWLNRLSEGCSNIGRSLSDSRGLFHSFRDCREHMLLLFQDLNSMQGASCLNWEIVFELRIKQSGYTRIYADVLIISEDRVFALEFKMKNQIEPLEVEQAAKYCPYLEILFGPMYDIIPVLVLTRASDQFQFVQVQDKDMIIPVCSGDMLFNVFNEYMGFLV